MFNPLMWFVSPDLKEERKFKNEEQPEGWVRGRAPSHKKSKIKRSRICRICKQVIADEDVLCSKACQQAYYEARKKPTEGGFPRTEEEWDKLNARVSEQMNDIAGWGAHSTRSKAGQ